MSIVFKASNLSNLNKVKAKEQLKLYSEKDWNVKTWSKRETSFKY
jgi:hypothetical protein